MAALIASACLVASTDARSQVRKLPDGSVVYNDGTRRLPNGTVIYKGDNNGTRNNGEVITLPDGSVVYRDGSRPYPNDRRDGRYSKHDNGEWLPPGQAKKIYGGRARDYAHGHKKEWKGNHRKGKSKHHDNDYDD